MEIFTPDCLVYVEAKVEADLGESRLRRYRNELAHRGVSTTALVLLTRYPVALEAGDEQPDAFVRWYEVAEWLEHELKSLKGSQAITAYLVHQFVDFLKAKGMTMEHIDGNLIPGMRALRNLLLMLRESITGTKTQLSANWNNVGMYLSIDGNKHWTGIYYNEPNKLYFATQCEIDKTAAENLTKLCVGHLDKGNWVSCGCTWYKTCDLESDGFFKLEKAQQTKYLEAFFEECQKHVRQIVLTNNLTA
jgi:hypothetical protein